MPTTIQERIRKPSADMGTFAVCVFGKGGAGKTTQLGSLPGRGLILDTALTEGGTMVLTPVADRVDVISVEQWDDFEKIIQDLATNNATVHKYRWCGIDSLTGAQVLAKVKTVKDRPLDTDPTILSQQDWGKMAELMSSLVLRLRRLKMHVICTAQQRTRDGVMVPNLSPASLDAMEPPMHLIGRLYVVEVPGADGKLMEERRLRVGTHESSMTKVRAVPGRDLPSVIRNPNLGRILDYLMGADVPRPEAVEFSTDFLGIETEE